MKAKAVDFSRISWQNRALCVIYKCVKMLKTNRMTEKYTYEMLPLSFLPPFAADFSTCITTMNMMEI